MADRLVLLEASDKGPAGLTLGVYIRRSTVEGMTASLMCPRCQLPLMLDPRSIEMDGEVDGGVACPCGWGATVQLSGWMK